MGNQHQRVWHRNQMEIALWRHAVTFRHWGADPDNLVSRIPVVFKSRIKKMLNLDRIPDMSPWDNPDDNWAFYDKPGEGIGSEDRFSAVHVFLMGIALGLLDIGLKQSEVIFFLKHMRPILQAAFDQINKRAGSIPPVSGSDLQRRFAKHYPDAEPLWLGPDKMPKADFTVWMLVCRAENKEAYPGFQRKIGRREIPLFMEPKFFFGLEAFLEAPAGIAELETATGGDFEDAGVQGIAVWIDAVVGGAGMEVQVYFRACGDLGEETGREAFAGPAPMGE